MNDQQIEQRLGSNLTQLLDGINIFLTKGLLIMGAIIGSILVVVGIWVAIEFWTAGGDEEKEEKARKHAKNVAWGFLIGVLIIGLSASIATILKELIGSGQIT